MRKILITIQLLAFSAAQATAADVIFFSRTFPGSGPPYFDVVVDSDGRAVYREATEVAWPAGTRLRAIDRDPAMIAQVWPGDPAAVVAADWLHVDLGRGVADLVVGDGCLNAVAWPDAAERLLDQVARWLRPGGRFVCRVFLCPDPDDGPEAVLARVLAAPGIGFHAFKLQLLTSLRTPDRPTVRVGDVWAWWQAHGAPEPDLPARTGWTPDQIATLDAYRDQATV
ncbi:MAG: class I SAM-dependent methyltransferase, partial [Acidobacteria bacterium]|nr:class I SAM-dependent methyltransferase [Acidobacteriota bacterium]